MNIAQALGLSAQLVESDSPDFDAQLLLAHVLGQSRSYLFTWPQRALSAEQSEQFEQFILRRIAGEPIAYILGYQDFWTLQLEVSPDTLIPRPDTEVLVELALGLNLQDTARIADLGTGTGAIALALASERGAWQIVASDFHSGAAALAERNRQRLSLANVEVLQGSWFEPLNGKFDAILSNPPYIESSDIHLSAGDVRFEPASALVSGASGLDDITHLVRGAVQYLLPGGWLLLEHGYNQGALVRELFEKFGYSEIHTQVDLAGNDRVSLGCVAR